MTCQSTTQDEEEGYPCPVGRHRCEEDEILKCEYDMNGCKMCKCEEQDSCGELDMPACDEGYEVKCVTAVDGCTYCDCMKVEACAYDEYLCGSYEMVSDFAFT